MTLGCNGSNFLSLAATLTSLKSVTVLGTGGSYNLFISPLVTQSSGALNTGLLSLGLAAYLTGIQNVLCIVASSVLQNTGIPFVIGSQGVFLLGLAATRALEGIYAALFTLSSNIILCLGVENPVTTQSLGTFNDLQLGLGLNLATTGADRTCLSRLGAGCADYAVIIGVLAGSGNILYNSVIACSTSVLDRSGLTTGSSHDNGTLVQGVHIDLLVHLVITLLTGDLLDTFFFTSRCLQNSFHIFMLALSLFCESRYGQQRENHQTRQNNGKNSSFHFWFSSI